jgi:hypothetical protein
MRLLIENFLLLSRRCNPSYSGGRDQDDHVRSQPEKPITKIGLEEWLKVKALSSSPSTSKKKKKRKFPSRDISKSLTGKPSLRGRSTKVRRLLQSNGP